jgi:putative ABC transport system substrate-binding protein
MERAISAFAELPDGGLIITPHPNNIANRISIIILAAGHHLPAIYPFRCFATAGGLLCCGSD